MYIYIDEMFTLQRVISMISLIPYWLHKGSYKKGWGKAISYYNFTYWTEGFPNKLAP